MSPEEGPKAKQAAASPHGAKPQVIFHLSKASGDAATLHAQAKGANNALPIDAGMPLSLQMARAAANDEAAKAAATPANILPNKSSVSAPASERMPARAQEHSLRRERRENSIRKHGPNMNRGQEQSDKRGKKSQKE